MKNNRVEGVRKVSQLALKGFVFVSILLSGCALEANRGQRSDHSGSSLKETALSEQRALEQKDRQAERYRFTEAEAQQRRARYFERARAGGEIGVLLADGDTVENISAVVLRIGKKAPAELNSFLHLNVVPLLTTLRPPFANHVAVSNLEHGSTRPFDATFTGTRYYPDRRILYFRSATLNRQSLGRMILIETQFYELPPTLTESAASE